MYSTNPVVFTDAAILYIKQRMSEEVGALGFRLSVKKRGCSGYTYEPEFVKNILAEDIYFMAQDNLPVYIDAKYASMMNGLLIDLVEENKNGLKQKQLVFINPNEKDRCGCGESFTV